MPACLVSLGSNLGDRAAHLRAAVERLTALPEVTGLVASRFYETAPVGGPSEQPAYLNAVVRLTTSLAPEQLLARLQQIEQTAERTREERWGPRTLDLDLLLYGDTLRDDPELTLPHPRLAVRRFVLVPAAEIASEMRHPTLGWSLGRVLEHLESSPAYAAVCGSPMCGKTELVCALVERGLAQAIFDRVDPSLPARLDAKPTTALPAVERILHTGRAQKLIEKTWPLRDPEGRPSRTQAVLSDFWIGQGAGYVAAWSGASRGAKPASDFEPDRELSGEIVSPRIILWLDAPVEWTAEQLKARNRPHERRLDAAWCERFRAGLAAALRRANCPVLRLDARDKERALQEAAAAIEASDGEVHPHGL